MIEINLLFFSRPFLMFNFSSEMSAYITFSRIPKCLHLLPFCVAVDATVRHPMPENEPAKVNDRDTLSYPGILAYHSPSSSYSLFAFFLFFFLFISSVFRFTHSFFCNKYAINTNKYSDLISNTDFDFNK